MLATQRWNRMVETEHAQSERMRGNVPPPTDHWQPYAQQFKADPRRSDDGLVNRLLEEVTPQSTVLDVGAGAGRLALPLALRCRRVVAVEPSASMGAVLRQQTSEFSIQNLSLVESTWEQAQVGPADLVICVHVLYVVREIEPFLRKLEAHARQRVLVVLFQAPPQSQTYDLWKQVHGEERLPLPSLPELQDVLSQLGIEFHLEMLPTQPPRGFDDRRQALEQLTDRLYLIPGTPQAARLEELLEDLLEETGGTFIIRGSQPLRPGLVWWRPEKGGQ